MSDLHSARRVLVSGLRSRSRHFGGVGSIALVCLAVTSALLPPGRGVAQGASPVEKLLEKLPPGKEAEKDEIGRALVGLGKAGVKELCGRLGEEPHDTKVCYALHGLVDYASRPGAGADRKMVAEALCDALRSGAPAAAKSYLLSELRLVGGAESVGAVKALLAVDGLCEPAAQTLVAFGTDGAAEALRGALPGLTGGQRITVLYALGRCRVGGDESAVSLLLQEAQSADAAIRRAAVYALANTGAPAAAEALREAAGDGAAEGSKALSLFGSSKYSPKVRSPRNMNLVKDVTVGSFVLDLRMLSTNKEYGHRDLCLFFGHQDPSHFYYVHIASKSDAHANSIFLVDGKPRVSIASSRTKGTKWDDGWHSVRLVRDVDAGKIEVYFDDMKKPIMTAESKRFMWGRIGVGSFDDTGMFDNIRIRGERAGPAGETAN